MGFFIYLVTLFVILFLALRYFVPPDDTRFALVLMLLTIPVQLMVLYLINSQVPFVPSEIDTFLYYQYSIRAYSSFNDYVDIWSTAAAANGFAGGLYLHLLTILNQLIADSLFWRKVFNLVALWPLVFAWYRIARILRGRQLARPVLVVIAWLPTLWYPFLVLYRDLWTAMLHSVFFAALLLYLTEPRRQVRHIVVAALAGSALFLFRPATIYINGLLVVLLIAGTFVAKSKTGFSKWKALLPIAALAACAILLLRFQTEFSLPIKTPQVAAEQVAGATEIAGVGSVLRVAVRTISYLPLVVASEPTITSKYLDLTDSEQMRGIMNGPWFILGTPFASMGLVMLLVTVVANYTKPSRGRGRREKTRIYSTASIGGPVAVRVREIDESDMLNLRLAEYGLLVYVLIWIAVCAAIEDFTRWRLPVVPALTVLGAWAFVRLPQQLRVAMLISWLLVIAVWTLTR